MRGEVEQQGTYKLFETTQGHEILVLINRNWFEVVEGLYGNILVKSDYDHQKKRTIQQGNFYPADFEDDPEFRDMPRLFPEEGESYKEFILRNDNPTGNNGQKKLVIAGDKIDQQKVREHVKGKGNTGIEKQYSQREPASGKERKKGPESMSKEELTEEAGRKKSTTTPT